MNQCRDLRMGVIMENLGALTIIRNTVLNLLQTIYLRLRRIVVHRVTVVKFGVDNKLNKRQWICCIVRVSSLKYQTNLANFCCVTALSSFKDPVFIRTKCTPPHL